MRILLSNDDGFDAPGIQILAEALATRHEVTVVAPAVEQSAKSHAFSMWEPIRVQKRGPGRFVVHGTPADCVYIGLHSLCEDRPDVVVSGVNKGANLGEDVHYSGTVAAAKEAALQGITGLAVSLCLDHAVPEAPRQFDTAAAVALRVLERIEAEAHPPRSLYNLNVPNRHLEDLKGLRLSGLGRRHYEALVDSRRDPRGRTYVWIGGPPVTGGPEAVGDVALVNQGYAVLTPLKVDVTDFERLEQIAGWAY